jgi:hypothetical protein
LNSGKQHWQTQEIPQAIWPIAKSLTNRNGPRAPTAIHGLLGLKYHPVDKANAVADCLENQFTPRDLCDKNHEWQVKARVQALLEAEDNDPLERIRPCDLQKLISDDGILNECLMHLPRRPLVHFTLFGFHSFPCLGRK